MLLSDLPVELLAKIADFLDVFQIEKFALVCHTFLTASSAAIRHYLQMKQNHGRLCICDDGLVAALDDMSGVHTYSLMDAMRLIKGQPRVAHWVKGLVVELSDASEHSRPVYEIPDLDMLQQTLETFSLNERLIYKDRHQIIILVMLILLLPELSTLVWDSHNMDYRAFFHMLDDVRLMSPAYHSIRISHVVIRRHVTEPFPDDRSIYYFMKWPSIQSLRAENCRHGFSDRIYLTNNRSWSHLPVMSNLTELSLIDCFIDDRHNWLHTVLVSVKTLLKFSYKASDSTYAASNTIEMTLYYYAREHLTELTLDRGPGNMIELFPKPEHGSGIPNLTDFHKLRHLETRFRGLDLHSVALQNYASKVARQIPNQIQSIRILQAHENETIHQRCIQLQKIVEGKRHPRLRILKRIELPQTACGQHASLESSYGDCTADNPKFNQARLDHLAMSKLQDVCKIHGVHLGWTDPVPAP